MRERAAALMNPQRCETLRAATIQPATVATLYRKGEGQNRKGEGRDAAASS